MKARLIAFASLLLLLGVVGCGETTGTVAGKATLNGEPVVFGLVIAYNEKGEQATSTNLTESGFVLENLPDGPDGACGK